MVLPTGVINGIFNTKLEKGGGNAIVPQVALQIFKAMEEYENLRPGF